MWATVFRTVEVATRVHADRDSRNSGHTQFRESGSECGGVAVWVR